MKLTRALWLLVLVPLTTAAQTRFFFDRPETFKHRVTVSTQVISLVTCELRSLPGCDEKASKESPTFEAWRIPLGARRHALMVRGYADCWHWADRFWFWIVLKNSKGYRVLLHAGSESLTVRNTLTHRFPDLETNAYTAEGIYRNVYKFNGKVYRVEMCTDTNAATRKTEPVTCRAQ